MLLLKKDHAGWAELSELTPATSYSLADHALAALKLEHDTAASNLSISDYLSLGVPEAE